MPAAQAVAAGKLPLPCNTEVTGCDGGKHSRFSEIENGEKPAGLLPVAKEDLRKDSGSGKAGLDSDAFRAKGAVAAPQQRIALGLSNGTERVEGGGSYQGRKADAP